jgi:major vault protein
MILILFQGEKSFFLKPGEVLESINDIHVLEEDESLLLICKEKFIEENGSERVAGDRWLIIGPCEFVPSIEVEVVEKRKAIPLEHNEGIYVKDLNTGEVKAVIGEKYILKHNEQLWEKLIPTDMNNYLTKLDPRFTLKKVKNKFDVISFRIADGIVIKIYNFKTNKSRIVSGPVQVMLQPDEEFVVMPPIFFYLLTFLKVISENKKIFLIFFSIFISYFIFSMLEKR